MHPDACWTVNVRSPIATVPIRAGPVVDATVKPIVPGPFCAAAVATVIHDTWLAAVQSHAAVVDTATVPAPPLLTNACASGVIRTVHPDR